MSLLVVFNICMFVNSQPNSSALIRVENGSTHVICQGGESLRASLRDTLLQCLRQLPWHAWHTAAVSAWHTAAVSAWHTAAVSAWHTAAVSQTVAVTCVTHLLQCLRRDTLLQCLRDTLLQCHRQLPRHDCYWLWNTWWTLYGWSNSVSCITWQCSVASLVHVSVNTCSILFACDMYCIVNSVAADFQPHYVSHCH